MSALHWEARRKQAVIDRKFEYLRRMQRRENANSGTNKKLSEVYNSNAIKEVAEELSQDFGTPTSAMLHRSRAQLNSRRNESRNQENLPEIQESSQECQLQPRVYSAKLPNRYTSTNYVQQH